MFLRTAIIFFAATALAAQQPAALSPDEIIARNLKARGGLDHLQAIQTIRFTRHMSTRSADGRTGQFDEIMELKRPNLIRIEERIPQGTVSVTTFDGARGWFASWEAPKAVELTGDQLKPWMTPMSDRLEGEYADYSKKGYRVESRGLQKSQGKDCYGLIITTGAGKQLYRCFDAQTFLDVEIRDENSTTIRSDFRPAGAVNFPQRMDVASAKGSTIVTNTKVEVDPKLDDADFRKPSNLKALALGDVLNAFGVSAEQVRAARRQIESAIQQVRTCPALPFVPACSFQSAPSQFKFTQKRIEFFAPINKEWGGPRQAFIDLTAMPELQPRPRDTWRLLNPEQQFQTVDPTERKFDSHASNIVFDRPRLEWPIASPLPKKFIEALEYLKANAHAEVGADEREYAEFHNKATAWRALAEKPALPDAVHREEVLAKNSLQADQNPEAALAHFEKGLAIEPLWPAGQLGAATICGELQRYDCAAQHAERFLELVPDGQQADVLRDKLIIWKDKLGKE